LNHYFENNENLESKLRIIAYTYKGWAFNFYSDLGVFSKDKIDYGSRLLVETLLSNGKKKISGVLDVGSGYGFIGTVLGIGKSLELANKAATEEGIKQITEALGVSFDTTFWSLVLCIILMYLVHSFQKKQDEFFSGMKDYIIENLINRFYK